MAFRVRVRDAVIEADNEAELRSVLNVLGLLSNTTQHTELSVAEAWKQVSPPSRDKLKSFYSDLIPNQRKVFHALAQAPDGLKDFELCKILGLQTNKELGGVMGGLSRKAAAHELKHENVITWSGSRYRLTPAMREVIPPADTGLSIEQGNNVKGQL